jgi:pimeloyl-ACP methyl ester carboxylesterase
VGLDERYLEDAGKALRRPSGWRAFVREQRALIRDLPILEPRLGQVVAPTTIMIGSADVVVPPASARRLAEQIPGAELVWIEGAGHLLPLRHAQRVAEVSLLVHDR